MESPELKERCGGQHFWASGYGVWSTGNSINKMVNEYLGHHRKKGDDGNSNFILELNKTGCLFRLHPKS